MRILQVTVSYYPELQFGGPPQKIHDLSRGLVHRGHDVVVATFRSARPRSGGRAMLDGVAVQYLPSLGRGGARLPLGVRALGQAVEQAEVVHIYGLYSLLGPLAARLAQRGGQPFFLEPQGMYVPRARSLRRKRLYHRLFTSWMGRYAARVIATSPAEVEDLRSASLAAPGKLVLRRNGVDLAQFADMPTGAGFRQRHGVGSDERVILYVGRISPIKNLEQLLVAFRSACLARARLILVGPELEPDYAARLHALAKELALDGRVIFVGPLYGRDKLEALAATDLFVLPSQYESYGNAAAEAVAAGVPVLLTETCGIAAQISGRAGLAVPLDEAALAAGLRTMLDDAGQRQAVTRARAEVVAELSWDAPLDLMESLYALALNVRT